MQQQDIHKNIELDQQTHPPEMYYHQPMQGHVQNHEDSALPHPYYQGPMNEAMNTNVLHEQYYGGQMYYSQNCNGIATS